MSMTLRSRRTTSSRCDEPGQCPNCGESLETHQPDPELPNRLLGVCEECKSWYVLDAELRIVFTIPLSGEEE